MSTIKRFALTALLTILFDGSDHSRIQYAADLSQTEAYDVILMGGQSNMVGQGNQDDLENMRFENVAFFDFGLNANLTKPKNNFGPEVGLSQELTRHYPDKKFILIKYAIGGASLLDWAPDYQKENAAITGHPEFGPMYRRLLALTDSLTKGYTINIQALLWMQGERDARIPEAGKDYHQNFERFIHSIRTDLNRPDLPVIFGKVNPPESRYPALDIVVKAQTRISEEDLHAYLINTDDCKKWADDLHYSSIGQIDLGRFFGKKLIEVFED